MKEPQTVETFSFFSASCFSSIAPFKILFLLTFLFFFLNSTADSALYGPSCVSLATRSTVLRSLVFGAFTLSGKKLRVHTLSRRNRTGTAGDAHGACSSTLFRGTSGSLSRDNSERGGARAGGASMPRGALFCLVWRPPASPPWTPADRSEY